MTALCNVWDDQTGSKSNNNKPMINITHKHWHTACYTYTRLFKYQLLQLSRTNLSLIFLTSNGKKNYFEYKLQSSYNLILQLIWLIH